jgi:hypothetical protein
MTRICWRHTSNYRLFSSCAVHPRLCLLCGPIQPGRDTGKPHGQLGKKIARPDVFTRENNKAYREEQQAWQNRDDETCDPQKGESPPNPKNQPSFARPVQSPLLSVTYRHNLVNAAPASSPVPRCGRACSISRTVRLKTGCRKSGAISANGSKTNRRKCIAGCGTSSWGVLITEFPNKRMSMSIVRGPLGCRRRRPICCSIASTFARKSFGMRCVRMAKAQFRNHGWAVKSTGSVS